MTPDVMTLVRIVDAMVDASGHVVLRAEIVELRAVVGRTAHDE